MLASPTAMLLDIWDAGSNLDHTGRALLMLQLARRDRAHSHDAELTIGERDGMLLDVREQLFGSQIDAVDQCAACGARVEVVFEVEHILGDRSSRSEPTLTIRQGDYEVEVRLPTSADLLVIRRCDSIESGRALLLERCITRAWNHGADVAAGNLPEPVQREIARAMGDADPLAAIELVLACAACGHEWPRQFDIVDYLWAEIARFGTSTLRDVHLLARHYGWSEDAIVGLSPTRRRRYLELVDNG